MINNIYVWIYEGSIWLRQNSKVDDQYRIVSKHRAVSISRTLLLIVESASYSTSKSVYIYVCVYAHYASLNYLIVIIFIWPEAI